MAEDPSVVSVRGLTDDAVDVAVPAGRKALRRRYEESLSLRRAMTMIVLAPTGRSMSTEKGMVVVLLPFGDAW